MRAASIAVMPSPTTSTGPLTRAGCPSRCCRRNPRASRRAAAGSLRRISRRPPHRTARGQDHGVETGVEQSLRVGLVVRLGAAHEADAGIPEGLQLRLEHLGRQAELGDEVAQRSAGLLLGVVDRDLMSRGRPRTRRRTRPAGPAPTTATRLPVAAPRGEAGSGVVGRRPVQVADGDGLVHVCPAGTPARSSEGRCDPGCRGRAVPPARWRPRRPRRRRPAPPDTPGCRCGWGRRACRGPRSRRCGRTGTSAGSSRGARARGGSRSGRQAVGHPGGAGGLQLVDPLDLHQAEAAAAPGRRAFQVAERRDVDAFAAGDVQHGLALDGPSTAGR